METLSKAFAPFEVKATDDEARTFTGLAAAWEVDLGGDVIHRGAFKKTLSDWRKSKKALPLIDQHNYGSIRSIVGKMLEAKETDEGLEATFQIIEGPDGDEIYRRVKGGYIDGLSIGYRAVKIETPTEEERRQGIWRHLKEVRLEEVSVVIWPMNPEARIESVKELAERAKAGTLSEDDRRVLVELKDAITALPIATPAEPKQADEEPAPKGAATYVGADALRLRIRLLEIQQAATR